MMDDRPTTMTLDSPYSRRMNVGASDSGLKSVSVYPRHRFAPGMCGRRGDCHPGFSKRSWNEAYTLFLAAQPSNDLSEFDDPGEDSFKMEELIIFLLFHFHFSDMRMVRIILFLVPH